MNSESFVYIWTNIQSGKFYIGKHKGTPDDGYICSSKIVKPMILKNPEIWSRKIVYHGTDKNCYRFESKLIALSKKKYQVYNISNGIKNPLRVTDQNKKTLLIINEIENKIQNRIKNLKENQYPDILIDFDETIKNLRSILFKKQVKLRRQNLKSDL